MTRIQPDFLKRLATVAGPSVAGFARRLRMPQTLVNNYCRGKTAPGYEFFARLAELGVDLHWLLTGKETAGKATRGLPDVPGKIAFLIQELQEDAEGMIGLEGMVDGYVRARRKLKKSAREND